MVLSLMRKHAKSWLIKFLIAIIAIVFIFYFGYSFTSQRGVKVASVNGENISGLEYQKAYRGLLEALQKEYKDVWSDNLIEVFDLKNRALENLIDQKLLSQEARRIGLDINEKEIQDQIMAYPAFQFQGWKRYHHQIFCPQEFRWRGPCRVRRMRCLLAGRQGLLSGRRHHGLPQLRSTVRFRPGQRGQRRVQPGAPEAAYHRRQGGPQYCGYPGRPTVL